MTRIWRNPHLAHFLWLLVNWNGKEVSTPALIDSDELLSTHQEVRTNAEGVYELQSLNPGPMNVTVVSPGWSPELRAINILASDSTENFQLEKGKSLLQLPGHLHLTLVSYIMGEFP